MSPLSNTAGYMAIRVSGLVVVVEKLVAWMMKPEGETVMGRMALV